jgi:hypothetical protein
MAPRERGATVINSNSSLIALALSALDSVAMAPHSRGDGSTVVMMLSPFIHPDAIVANAYVDGIGRLGHQECRCNHENPRQDCQREFRHRVPLSLVVPADNERQDRAKVPRTMPWS